MARYDAFISYSHTGGDALAASLQRGLHRIAKPWYRLPTLHVFRDDTSLTATSTLWSTIEGALGESEYFVLLASPVAATRPWITREIEWWLDNRSTETFMLVLSDGELVWSDSDNDFARSSTALPDVLHERFNEEPLWVDLRWTDGQPRSLRDPQFRDSVAKLAAPMHGAGTTPATLVGEDLRQQRNVRRWRTAAIAALVALTVIAGIAAFVAQRQATEARLQRDRAISRQLAAQADVERGDRIDRALLLSLAALEVDDTTEARSALAGAIEQVPSLKGFLHGTEGTAGAVAHDPTGRLVVTGDGSLVRLWRADDGRAVGSPLREHEATVVAGGFNRDGTTFATADEDGRIVLWDAATRTSLSAYDVGDLRPVSVTFDPSLGLAALAAGDDGAVVVDLGSGTELARIPPTEGDRVVSAAFSLNGQALAFGSEIGAIAFWDVEARQVVGPRIEIPIGDYSQSVGTLAFGPDGETVASGSPGGIVNLWDVRSGRRLGSFGETSGDRGPVTALTFNPDGRLLISGHQEREVNVWSVDEDLLIDSWPGHGVVAGLSVHPDDTSVAVASDEGPVVRYDITGPRRSRMAKAFGEPVSSAVADPVLWSPDGELLVAATFDDIHVYDGASGEQRGAPLTWEEDSFVEALDFSPDGSLLASSMSRLIENPELPDGFGSSGSIVIWDVAERARIAGPLRDGSASAGAVAFSPDGQQLAVGDDDGVVELWAAGGWTRADPPLGREGGQVEAIAFSPDGQQLAVGDADGRVEVWDLADGARQRAPLRTEGGAVHAVAFTPDGRRVVTGDQEGLTEIWSLSTGAREGEPLTDTSDAVSDLDVSHDGRRVAIVGGRTSAVSVWDLDTRRLIVKPADRADGFESVAFSPDDSYVAWGSGSIAPQILLVRWDASLEAWRRHACALAGRDLTAAEWNRYIGSQAGDQTRVCDGRGSSGTTTS